ncbi:glycosyltransferase [Calothrix sp. PCC 6303]|uniref:glycosyltransferase n=1 Tax=Calothrix sp. PCC 6303 TaxID=1170562 RepID=UPI0002A00CF9|nr:glycosyltransferase [Calothrix sp. PCC 6303]AFZ02256.1 glycosyl transferase group 1 [Calothrix sp. PCC 6303]
MKITAYPAFKTKYKNPYNWLLYNNIKSPKVTVAEFSAKDSLRGDYDILHLHWVVETIIRHPNLIQAFLRAIMMLILIDLLRKKGTKVVWTIHDENPHSIIHPQLGNWFQKQFLHRLDGYISLSEYSNQSIEKNLPHLQKIPHTIVRHGHYRDVYPNKITPQQARDTLGITEKQKVLLFFGYIDVYKNVPHLIQTFRELAPPDWTLVIAGKIERDSLKDEIITATNNDSQVKLFLEYIPDEQVQLYFQSADLVVLPFQEILNSGSALLSLSFNRPILVPALGSIPELQNQVGKDWVKMYFGEFNTINLQSGLDWFVDTKRCENTPIDNLDWRILANQTLEFYQQILNQK